MAVRSTQGRNRAARITQGGVTLMVMVHALSLSGLEFQIKYIVTKVKKNFFVENIYFAKINAPSPFTQTWDCLALSFHVNVSVYVKRG